MPQRRSPSGLTMCRISAGDGPFSGVAWSQRLELTVQRLAQAVATVGLAALRIAGELFEARDEAARLTTSLRELSDEIRPWLPPAKRHD